MRRRRRPCRVGGAVREGVQKVPMPAYEHLPSPWTRRDRTSPSRVPAAGDSYSRSSRGLHTASINASINAWCDARCSATESAHGAPAGSAAILVKRRLGRGDPVARHRLGHQIFQRSAHVRQVAEVRDRHLGDIAAAVASRLGRPWCTGLTGASLTVGLATP
jgi:hypothetical protein